MPRGRKQVAELQSPIAVQGAEPETTMDLFDEAQWYVAERSSYFSRLQQTVTVQKGGILSISGDFQDRLVDSDGVGYVKLGYVPRTRQVLIQPVPKSTKGALSVTKPKGTRYFVDAQRFFANTIPDFSLDERITCPAQWVHKDDEVGAIVFSLDDRSEKISEMNR